MAKDSDVVKVWGIPKAKLKRKQPKAAEQKVEQQKVNPQKVWQELHTFVEKLRQTS